MTKEELEKEAEEYYDDVTVGTFQECIENFADAVLTAYKDSAEPRENCISELKEAMEAKEQQLTRAKELLLELYDCIPSSMADSCKETLQKVALFFKDSEVSE